MIDPLADERVRYAHLRDGARWPDVALDGLQLMPDGTLELRRLPAVTPPHVAMPDAAEPSGLALDDRCGLYLSDATRRRLVRDALDCPHRYLIPGVPGAGGPFDEPRGTCFGPFGWLFVADAGAGRIVVLSTPDLSVRDAWTVGLARPVAVTPAGDTGVYVLDAGLDRVLRFDAFGRADAGFDARLAPPVGPPHPRAIAAAADGALYVAVAGGVERFTPAGDPAGSRLANGTRPQALALAGEVLYVADAQSGQILPVSCLDGEALGSVDGFSGPVSALAVGADGRLYVKTGSDDHYLVAEPGAGRVRRGTLATERPLDAGEDATWWRATADTDIPDGASVVLELAAEIRSLRRAGCRRRPRTRWSRRCCSSRHGSRSA